MVDESLLYKTGMREIHTILDRGFYSNNTKQKMLNYIFLEVGLKGAGIHTKIGCDDGAVLRSFKKQYRRKMHDMEERVKDLREFFKNESALQLISRILYDYGYVKQEVYALRETIKAECLQRLIIRCCRVKAESNWTKDSIEQIFSQVGDIVQEIMKSSPRTSKSYFNERLRYLNRTKINVINSIRYAKDTEYMEEVNGVNIEPPVKRCMWCSCKLSPEQEDECKECVAKLKQHTGGLQ
jgi:hypothetical protein